MDILKRKAKDYEIIEDPNYINGIDLSSIADENSFVTDIITIETLPTGIYLYRLTIQGDFISKDMEGIANKLTVGQIGLLRHYDTDYQFKENKDAIVKIIHASTDGTYTILDVIAKSKVTYSFLNKVFWNITLFDSYTTKYEVPTNIHVTNFIQLQKSVTVYWDAMQFATGYALCYRKQTDVSNHEWIYVYDIQDTKYSLYNLELNTYYGVCVLTCYESSLSAFSDELTFRT